ARSLVSDTGLLLLFSAVALGGMGIGNVVIPPLVKRYFSDRVALLSAMYITGVQLGTAIPPLVAVPVAEAAGWRISLGMWALVALAALLPALGLWWSHRREDSRTVARPLRRRRSPPRSPVTTPMPASMRTPTPTRLRFP